MILHGEWCHRNYAVFFCLLIALMVVANPAFAEDPLCPRQIEEESNWLDTYYQKACNSLQGYVVRADSLFAKTEEDKLAISNSTFQLESVFEIRNEHKVKYEFSPRFDADLHIPNLKRSYKIFINTLAPDELPGIKEADRDRSIFIGLSYDFYRAVRTSLIARVGVKWRWPPIAFSRIEYNYIFKGERWKIFPRQRFYWYSDDGFGETTSLQMSYKAGKKWVLRSESALKFAEITKGAEWEHSFSLGYVMKEKSEKLDYALGCEVGAHGYYDDSHGQVDRYSLSFIYRRPFLRDWMFIKFVPEVEYVLEGEELRDDDEYLVVPSFSIGVDMLFYGNE